MTPRDGRAFCNDILGACDHIVAFLQGREYESFETDVLLRSAVERQLSIIGEAIFLLGKLDPEITNRVTGYRQIVALRHRLVHGYYSTSPEILWRIAHDNVSGLRCEIQDVLNELSPKNG